MKSVKEWMFVWLKDIFFVVQTSFQKVKAIIDIGWSSFLFISRMYIKHNTYEQQTESHQQSSSIEHNDQAYKKKQEAWSGP